MAFIKARDNASGINLAADLPGRAMGETSPERVAGGTFFICSVYPHPGLKGRLHIVPHANYREAMRRVRALVEVDGKETLNHNQTIFRLLRA